MDFQVQCGCCTPELTATAITCTKSTQDRPVSPCHGRGEPLGAPLLSEDLHAVKVDEAG